MRAGRLKWRVTVRRATVGRDAMNAPVESWADLGTFRADRLQQRASEGWKAGQTAAQLETAWRLRWSPMTATITPADRLTVDGVEYRIVGVTEPTRRREVEIVAVADL